MRDRPRKNTTGRYDNGSASLIHAAAGLSVGPCFLFIFLNIYTIIISQTAILSQIYIKILLK